MMVLRIVMEKNTTTKPLNQNKMKQTAVEWLADKMLTEHHSKIEWDKIVEQAKEMEREQIENAHEDGCYTGKKFNQDPGNFETLSKEYYNEIFK